MSLLKGSLIFVRFIQSNSFHDISDRTILENTQNGQTINGSCIGMY